MRITYKIGLMAAVPLVAAAGFGASTMDGSISALIEARHLGGLIKTVEVSDDLVHQLQVERTVTATYLSSAGVDLGSAASAPVDDLVAATGYTDKAIAEYRAQKPDLTSLPTTSPDLVQRIDHELSELPALRARVRAAEAPALSAVVFQYHDVIADLLAFRDDVAQSGSAPPSISSQLRLSGLLDQAAECVGQEQARVNRIPTGSTLTAAAQQDIAAARTGYTTAMDAYLASAPAEWHDRPALALTGPMVQEARRLEDLIARLPVGGVLEIDQHKWTVDMTERINRLQSVQEQIDGRTERSINGVEMRSLRLAIVQGAGVLGAIVIAILISFRLGRPMIRGLRQLKDAAHAVAYEHLPASVANLRAAGPMASQSPEELATATGQVVPVTGTDEIAAVARAFNSVHTEAVRIAAEQAQLRAGVGRSFVALARRGERLTGALTMELDRAERAEQDPDRLSRLFTLDHLAARMSRNNESLLVLGGEGTVRIRESAVPMLDTVRAALGRVDKYARVVPGRIDPSVVIAAEAVDHVVHLLAELLDNATTFSPPHTEVVVDAEVVTFEPMSAGPGSVWESGREAEAAAAGGGAGRARPEVQRKLVVRIEDRGIGIAESVREELNLRLAAPRTLDLAAVQAMGLTVVARLASWYRIDVELRPAPGGRGTVAVVTLPGTVFRVVGVEAVEDVLSTSGARQLAPVLVGEELAESGDGFGAVRPGEVVGPGEVVTSGGAAVVDGAALGEGGQGTDAGEPPAVVEVSAGVAETLAEIPAQRSDRTENGLPRRVPLARLGDAALSRKAATAEAGPEPEPEEVPENRDPAEAAAAMAAFARGISGGHGDDEPNRFPAAERGPATPVAPPAAVPGKNAKQKTPRQRRGRTKS